MDGLFFLPLVPACLLWAAAAHQGNELLQGEASAKCRVPLETRFQISDKQIFYKKYFSLIERDVFVLQSIRSLCEALP